MEVRARTSGGHQATRPLGTRQPQRRDLPGGPPRPSLMAPANRGPRRPRDPHAADRRSGNGRRRIGGLLPSPSDLVTRPNHNLGRGPPKTPPRANAADRASRNRLTLASKIDIQPAGRGGAPAQLSIEKAPSDDDLNRSKGRAPRASRSIPWPQDPRDDADEPALPDRGPPTAGGSDTFLASRRHPTGVKDHRFDRLAFLDRVPLERIAYVHVGGGGRARRHLSRHAHAFSPQGRLLSCSKTCAHVPFRLVCCPSVITISRLAMRSSTSSRRSAPPSTRSGAVRSASVSSDRRARLQAREAELIARALRRPGRTRLDGRMVTVAGEALVRKRARAIARILPALARGTEPEFFEHFAAFARSTPPPGHASALVQPRVCDRAALSPATCAFR